MTTSNGRRTSATFPVSFTFPFENDSAILFCDDFDQQHFDHGTAASTAPPVSLFPALESDFLNCLQVGLGMEEHPGLFPASVPDMVNNNNNNSNSKNIQRDSCVSESAMAQTVAPSALMQDPSGSGIFSGLPSQQALSNKSGPVHDTGSIKREMTPVPAMDDLPHSHPPPRAVLHIQHDGNKSRVETQINTKLTLDPLPDGIKNLHLPTHAISKPKLLAKDTVKASDTLELHVSLVCATAMKSPESRARALRRASSFLSNARKSSPRRSPQPATTDHHDDPDDADNPANGGEVRICPNCIQRERKRAARKKQKKPDDEKVWAEYEDDRVIVFNDKEYKEWAAVHPASPVFSPSAKQIEVPMRIACYCRHQGEKIGFCVIFTIKDYLDQLVAQTMTAPILITDDHKTQAPPLSAGTSTSPELPSRIGTPPHLPVTMPQPGLHHAYPVLSNSQPPQDPWPNPNPFHHQTALQAPTGLAPYHPSAVLQPTPAMMTPPTYSRPLSPTEMESAPNKRRKTHPSEPQTVPPRPICRCCGGTGFVPTHAHTFWPPV